MDERLLYDTFSAFGVMATTAKVRRVALGPLNVIHPSFLRLHETHRLVSQKDTVSYHIQISNLRMLPLNQ